MLFVVSVFAAFSPFIFLAFFNHPSVDDFCYTNFFNDPDIDSVLKGVMEKYRLWNARYFSVTLIGVFFRSLNLIEAYKSVPLLLFVGWFISGFIFLKSIFNSTRWPVVVVGALTFCIFYIFSMPKVSAGFYWMNSAFQYQTGNILAMAAMACMIRIGSTRNPYPYVLIAVLLIFTVVGSTEMHMALMVILVTSVTLYVCSTHNRDRHIWIFLLLVTLLSAALLILAPGNEGRGQHFATRHQFWFSMTQSAHNLGIWSLRWFSNPLLWLATLLNILWLRRFAQESRFCQRIRRSHLVFILPCWVVTLFACFFIAFWSMGVSLPGRALNVVYFIFLIGWFSSVAVGVKDIQIARVISTSALGTSKSHQVIGALATIAMIIGLLNTEVFQTAYADLFERAQKYDEILQDRYRRIASARSIDNKLQVVKVPEVTTEERPSTIMVDDIRSDRRDFRNTCYAEYFGIPAIETAKDRFWEQSRPIFFKDDSGIALSEYAYYVFDYADLKSAWEASGENINTWGVQHWTSNGQKEGRKITSGQLENLKMLKLHRQTNDTIDQVSCAVKGVMPDGRPDLLFTLDIDIPENEGTFEAITHIRLNRSMPGGTYQSTDRNYVLGISTDRDGPLINNGSGRIRIKGPITGQRLWLFACADGHDTQNSIYFAEARFQRWPH